MYILTNLSIDADLRANNILAQKTAGVLVPSLKDYLLTNSAVKNTLKDLVLTGRRAHASRAHRLYTLRKAEELMAKAKALDPGLLGRAKESIMLTPAISDNVSALNREAQRAASRERKRLIAKAELAQTAGNYGKGALLSAPILGTAGVLATRQTAQQPLTSTTQEELI